MHRSLFVIVSLLTACSGTPAALTAADLEGRWASAGCEAYPAADGTTTYLTRDFTFTATRWQLDLDVHGDAACSSPLFSAAIEGPYAVGGSSVEGATDGEFSFATNVWTAHVADLATVFTASGCGAAPWEVGVPQDVASTGCIGVAHDVDACPTEHDLVGIDEAGELHLGQRDVDLCTTRPTALGSYGLTPR